MYSEPPRFEVAEMQAHPSSNINSSPLSSVQQDPNISTGAESLPPAKASGASTTFEPKAGRAGMYTLVNDQEHLTLLQLLCLLSALLFNSCTR